MAIRCLQQAFMGGRRTHLIRRYSNQIQTSKNEAGIPHYPFYRGAISLVCGGGASIYVIYLCLGPSLEELRELRSQPTIYPPQTSRCGISLGGCCCCCCRSRHNAQEVRSQSD